MKNMAEPVLYVTDLDGTLLGADSKVSSASAAMLNEAIAAGALFSIATARTPATVDSLMRGIDVKLPMIVMTGAAMWDSATRRYMEPRLMDASMACEVAGIIAGHGINPFLYTLDPGEAMLHMWHTPAMNQREWKFADERRGLELKRFHTVARLDPSRGDTILMFAISSVEAVEACAEALRAATECTVSAYRDIFNHEVAFLEVFAPGVSKAAALSRLVDLSGARSSVVFGDNLNDIAMMETATLGVAVENAFEAVRRQAGIIIGPNTADSVARYICGAATGRDC